MRTNKKVTSGEWRVTIDRHVRSSAFTRQDGQPPDPGFAEARGGTPNGDVLSPVTRHSSLVTRNAFTLIEILVVVVLMSLIILALMTVFNTTQTAFRASLTQTDVLEGGRAAMGMIKSDLESMTPSFGWDTNQAKGLRFVPGGSGQSWVPVNFYASNNVNQYQSGSAPLTQSLLGTSDPKTQRTNVLQNFFILTRQNMTWTGVGYFVDTTSTNYFNPLYRFSMSTNVQAADPTVLFNMFLTNLPAFTGSPIAPNTPNMSHLMNGVVHLTVRAHDPNGFALTNYYYDYVSGLYLTNINKNLSFSSPLGSASGYGEVGFYLFSNTVPASVEINLGVLEDRTLQRAESLPNLPPAWAQSNYLAGHVGQVHVFRQRVWIRNVDPSAYQP
jgi:prepilin-type N-terminal cleavage/methylation domain-containing protein